MSSLSHRNREAPQRAHLGIKEERVTQGESVLLVHDLQSHLHCLERRKQREGLKPVPQKNRPESKDSIRDRAQCARRFLTKPTDGILYVQDLRAQMGQCQRNALGDIERLPRPTRMTIASRNALLLIFQR